MTLRRGYVSGQCRQNVHRDNPNPRIDAKQQQVPPVAAYDEVRTASDCARKEAIIIWVGGNHAQRPRNIGQHSGAGRSNHHPERDGWRHAAGAKIAPIRRVGCNAVLGHSHVHGGNGKRDRDRLVSRAGVFRISPAQHPGTITAPQQANRLLTLALLGIVTRICVLDAHQALSQWCHGVSDDVCRGTSNHTWSRTSVAHNSS